MCADDHHDTRTQSFLFVGARAKALVVLAPVQVVVVKALQLLPAVALHVVHYIHGETS